MNAASGIPPGRQMTRDELLFVIRVQRETIGQLLDELADVPRQLAEVAEQVEAAVRADERCRIAVEFDTQFTREARKLKAAAGRPTFAERRARELEWAKPKPGDFTGRLTPAEYFGTDAPAPAAEGLRAA